MAPGTTLATARFHWPQVTIAAAMTMLLTLVWCLTHHYFGLAHDAQVYALQAISKLEPNLADDLFFHDTSQDQFSVFSRIYAQFIGILGLPRAAVTLFVLFTIWFVAAGWTLARNLFDRDVAWLCVVVPMITQGTYGAYHVFEYSEQFLTARLAAEALVVTALACYAGGRRGLGLAVAVTALSVHPLIALPGVLMILGLWAPLRISIAAAVLGCLGTLGLAALAVTNDTVGHLLKVMDPEWANVVFERLEFLFPSDWQLDDWMLNLRGFLCLSITATLASQPNLRRWCVVAALLALCGIAVSIIASSIGPTGVMMQGQAWRWIWIGTYLSTLFLIPTAYVVWRDDKCGPLCAMLLVSAWTFAPINGTACAALALAIWLVRGRITAQSAAVLRLAAGVFGLVIAAWLAGNIWTFSDSNFDTGRESLFLQWARNIGTLQILVILTVAAAWQALRRSRSALPPVAVCVLLLVALAATIPPTFAQVDKLVFTDKSESFTDWQQRIPPTSTVLVLRSGDSGGFAWLTLRRTNYLSSDQSVGVVFSRANALEIKRRSAVVAPLKDEDWKTYSYRAWYQTWILTHTVDQLPPRLRPLTAEKLRGVCADPGLGFVIAKEYVGFDAVRHRQRGPFKDWNLYDCNRVRAAKSAS